MQCLRMKTELSRMQVPGKSTSSSSIRTAPSREAIRLINLSPLAPNLTQSFNLWSQWTRAMYSVLFRRGSSRSNPRIWDPRKPGMIIYHRTNSFKTQEIEKKLRGSNQRRSLLLGEERSAISDWAKPSISRDLLGST